MIGVMFGELRMVCQYRSPSLDKMKGLRMKIVTVSSKRQTFRHFLSHRGAASPTQICALSVIRSRFPFRPPPGLVWDKRDAQLFASATNLASVTHDRVLA